MTGEVHRAGVCGRALKTERCLVSERTGLHHIVHAAAGLDYIRRQVHAGEGRIGDRSAARRWR